MRSGDFHPIPQYDIILSGVFELTLHQDGKDIVMQKHQMELIVIPPNVPHLFRALTDTVMIEWWPGPFEAEYYEPYRNLIDKQVEENQTIK
jgi:quercetin dioxygenase-like cupin family protein